MNWRVAATFAAFVLAAGVARAQTPPRPLPAPPAPGASADKQPPAATQSTADEVVVFGCLKHKGTNDWVLANATEAIPADKAQAGNVVAEAGKADAPKNTPETATPELPVGKFEYDLVSASIFGPNTVADRTVQITGVLIHLLPHSRITVSSMIQVAPRCPVPRP